MNEQFREWFASSVGVIDNREGNEEGLAHFALPPTLILTWPGKTAGLWFLQTSVTPEDPFPFCHSLSEGLEATNKDTWLLIPEHGYRVMWYKPHLRYALSDLMKASRLEQKTVDLIRSRPTRPLVENEEVISRNTDELAVITDLRRVGFSEAMIARVFDEQPIGDPYQVTSSLLGSLSLSEVFLRFVVNTLADGIHDKFLWAYDTALEILWVNTRSALEFWYPFQRGQGGRILQPSEMDDLLRQASLLSADSLGSCLLTNRRVLCQGHIVHCYGVHLGRAVQNGLLSPEQREKLVGTILKAKGDGNEA